MKFEIVESPEPLFEDQRVIAITPWRAHDFEAILNTEMVCYVEDGLGEARAICLKLGSGRTILARELCKAPIPRLVIEAGSDHTAALDEVLNEFPLGLDDYLWTLRDASSDGPTKLYREDDNGIRFLVGEFDSLVEARLKKHDLESGGHKQHYWTERVGED